MQKGDKFIVTDNKQNCFEINEVVVYLDSTKDKKHLWVESTNKSKRIFDRFDWVKPNEIKPLDRFPADDEQTNN